MAREYKRPENVYPLEKFPQEKRDEIAWLVEQDSPPPRWLNLTLAQIESRAWYEWHWARGIYPGSTRDPLPAGMREAVIARDGHVCQLCGGDVEPNDIHIDHIKPWSKGGKHVLSNLQVTHSRCNLRKGAKVLEVTA